MIATIELLASLLLTLALHATLVLGVVWLLERVRVLRGAQALELAWRLALFGTLLSTGLSVAIGSLSDRPRMSASIPDAKPAQAYPQQVARPTLMRESHGLIEATAINPVPARAADARQVAAWQSLSVSPEIARAFVAAWLAGVALASFVFLRRNVALGRRVRRALRDGGTAPAPLGRLVQALAVQHAVRTPELYVLDDIDSPMVVPGGLLLLPSWITALDRNQQRALLAHEFAHIVRRDPFWRIAQHAALVPLFFHPLAWLARQRLESLAEDACDSAAASTPETGRALAECLAACLTHARHQCDPVLAVGMAGATGSIIRRVQRLLEEPHMSIHVLSPAVRRSVVTLAFMALVALPGLAVTTSAREASAGSVHTRSWNGYETISFRDEGSDYSLKIEQKGNVEFTDDETDVARMANGAQLEIVETKAGVVREIRFDGLADAIERRYRRDGTERPLDAEGRAWIAAMLPQMLRESGIRAGARGKHLLERGGAPALLAEIDLIHSDHARQLYLAVLFANAKLSPVEQMRALAQAGAMSSDFEKRNALQAALRTRNLTPEAHVQLLHAASSIGSDFEKAELLTSVASDIAVHGEVLTAWIEVVEGFDSDFERRRSVEALFEHARPSGDALVRIIDGARSVDSDFEKRTLLEKVVPHLAGSNAARDAYLRVATGIDSAFERRQALSALLAVATLDVAAADAVLACIATMDSEFESRETLVELARVMPADAGLIERYRTIARKLGDYERGQAEKALDRFAVL